MDFIRRYQKELALGAGVAALSAGLWYFLSNSSEEQSEVSQADLVSNITVKRANGRLTMGTINQIYEAIGEASKPRVSKLIVDDRKMRRSNNLSDKEYAEAFLEFNKQLQETIAQVHAEVVQLLSLSEEEFDASVEAYLNEENEELMQILTTNLPNVVKNAIFSAKILDVETLRKVMKGQAEYLKNNISTLKNFAAYASTPQHFVGLIQSKINDNMAAELGVEPEDVSATLNVDDGALRRDPQVQTYATVIETTIRALMTSTMARPTYGMGGPNGGPSGMMGGLPRTM